MPTSSDDMIVRPQAHLRVADVTAGYGGAPVISSVRMQVGLGEVVTVVGPNGAGKSTLLKAVMGHIPVMSGSVSLADEDVTNLRTDMLARKGIGYVPQVGDVFDTLTVTDNLEMGGYLLSRMELAKRIEEVLEFFPALATMRDRHASKLSGGERKMLAMARVLMLRPTVLVLDEPTSNLSPELSRVVLRDHVARLADHGTAVLLVEQKALDALEISHYAYIMVAGKAAIEAPAKELLARTDIGEIFLGRAVEDSVSKSSSDP